MDDCIFCKLANGQIPTEMVYENDLVACFKDNNPQTRTHCLIVPKTHYRDILDMGAKADWATLGPALEDCIDQVTTKLGIKDQGFRLINNCGEGAGQSVFHVHFHLMSDPEKLKEKLL